MPNIASVLKEEIARLARKELKANTESLKQAVSTYRSEIAALKRRVVQLERQQKRVVKAIPTNKPVAAGDDASFRFSAKGLASHRSRLGLSAEQLGALIGVTGQSIYKWEAGKARPRDSQLPAIAEIRTIGKREVAKRLKGQPAAR